jgi:hypothetical protein
VTLKRSTADFHGTLSSLAQKEPHPSDQFAACIMSAVHQQGKEESPAWEASPYSPLQRDACMQLGTEENQQYPARVPSPHIPPQQDAFMQVGTSDIAQIQAPSPAYMESTKSDQVAPELQDQRKGTYENAFQEDDCWSCYFWGECVLETCQVICCCCLLFAG